LRRTANPRPNFRRCLRAWTSLRAADPLLHGLPLVLALRRQGLWRAVVRLRRCHQGETEFRRGLLRRERLRPRTVHILWVGATPLRKSTPRAFRARDQARPA